MWEHKDFFNDVRDEHLTAICRLNHDYRGEYPELEIGKEYKVSEFCVLRSQSKIIIDDLGEKEYNTVMFDIFEDGEPIHYTQRYRFLAPYLRQLNRVTKEDVVIEDVIPHRLRRVELEFGVNILFAVESGSRGMGI